MSTSIYAHTTVDKWALFLETRRSIESWVLWDSNDWFVYSINPVQSTVMCSIPQRISNPAVDPLVMCLYPNLAFNECLVIVCGSKQITEATNRTAAKKRESVGQPFFPTFLPFFFFYYIDNNNSNVNPLSCYQPSTRLTPPSHIFGYPLPLFCLPLHTRLT